MGPWNSSSCGGLPNSPPTPFYEDNISLLILFTFILVKSKKNQNDKKIKKIKEFDFFDYFIIKSSLHLIFVIIVFF